MAKLTVYTFDGGRLTIAALPDDSVAELVQAFYSDADETIHTFAFNLDDGTGMSYIRRAAIARIDVDWETSED